MKKVMSPIFPMTYYGTSLFLPDTVGAGLIAQRVADTAKHCGYPKCRGKVVGAAVHSANVIEKDEQGRSIYKDGSYSLPVCKKHRAWEFAKLNEPEPWGWML